MGISAVPATANGRAPGVLRMMLGAAVVALGLAVTLGHAGTEAKVKSATGSKAGLPDWNGVWVLVDSFMDKQDGTSPSAPGRFDAAFLKQMMANQPALMGEYLAKSQAMMKAQFEGKPIGDSGALCLPQGMPNFWFGPYSYEIIQSQTGKQLNLYQEWNEQTRRIYLDGRKHPEDYDPTYNGHSIGHWEGKVLVVDTTGIREDTGLGFASGTHSDAIHITERFKTVGPDLLDVGETVEDPKALSKPWVTTIHLRRKQGMEIMNYVCAENNRNPVDAGGITGTVLQKP